MTNESRSVRGRAALLQGLAVLMGILIAFSIDAWWEEQGDRRREEALLVALSEELVANRGFFEEDLERVRSEQLETAEYLRDVGIGGGVPPSPDSILAMLWTTSPSVIRQPRRAALDDLLSSGAFQYIRSDSIRRAITEYEVRLRSDLESQRRGSDYWEQYIQPYQADHASLADMLPPDSNILSGVRPGDTGFGVDVDAYYQNRVFSNMLTARAIRFSSIRMRHSAALAAIEELALLIEKEIN